MTSQKPVLHIIGLFHTIPSHEWSHCAFTGKVLRFSKMMHLYGYKVIEYSNGESESEADEKVQILSREELQRFIDEAKGPDTKFHGDIAKAGSALHKEFSGRLTLEMITRVKKGDLICHPFGVAHQHLLVDLQPCGPIHLESGIGYPQAWCGQRIYESSAWMHWHYGKGDQQVVTHKVGDNLRPVTKGKGGEVVTTNVPIEWGKNYHFVAPNYFDLDEWPVVTSHQSASDEGVSELQEVFDAHIELLNKQNVKLPPCLLQPRISYNAFLGRIYDGKGVHIIVQIANMMPEELFIICGQGDPAPYLRQSVHRNLIAMHPITGTDRAVYLGGAKCALMPTMFIEPFGGSGVEAMLCGTPLIASNYGAFCETVIQGKTGYRCNTLGDWCEAIRRAPKLDRARVAELSRERYSLKAVGKQYDAILMSIADLARQGYMSSHSHSIE